MVEQVKCEVKDCRYRSNKGFCMVKRTLTILPDGKCFNYEKEIKLEKKIKQKKLNKKQEVY